MVQSATAAQTSDEAIREIGPIVVAFDGSAAAQRALLQAAILAAGRCTVVVVAVAEPDFLSAGGETLAKGLSPQEADVLVEDASSLLAERNVRYSTRTEQGEVADTLVTVARTLDAAMIVVGARGRDFVRRTLVGSVASALVVRAHCDVLVVR